MDQVARAELFLPDPSATTALGEQFATVVRPGDTFLLSGPIGAGKTHFARALIQAWLAKNAVFEDVPSPTYTLVQTYSNGTVEIWHADLYRLSTAEEADELGLIEAIGKSIVLIEWPDRLGDAMPTPALTLDFAAEKEGRRVTLTGPTRLTNIVGAAA